MSRAIIRGVVGLSGEELRRAARSYVDLEVQEGDGIVNVARILDLGDLLYLLRDVPGFDHFVTRFRTEPWEQTASVIHMAGAFLRSGHRISFVRESGSKMADYDLVVYVGTTAVNTEAKCKIEETAYSSSSLLSTLRHARGQLPKAGPGLVVVQIPQAWHEDPSFRAEVGAVVERYLKDTKRVNCVLLMGTLQHRSREGLEQNHWKWDHMNPAPRVPVAGLDGLVAKMEVPSAPGSKSRVWASYWPRD